MKNFRIFAIVVLSYILEGKVVAEEVVKAIQKDGTFYFTNTAIGRALASKLRHTEGYENSIIVLTDDHGTGLKLERGSPIILANLPNPNASVIATLNLSRVHDADVTLMKLMRVKCTGNIYVVTPLLTLTALDALILAYENAHGPARAVTLVPLIAALNAIMLTFQLFSNLPANKSNSIVIVQSGGFHVKGVGGSHPQIWEAFQSNVAGEILMTFPFCEANHCYDVWSSTDGIAWVRTEPVIHAHARIGGLTPNTYIWVRYQLVIEAGGQGGYIPLKLQVPA